MSNAFWLAFWSGLAGGVGSSLVASALWFFFLRGLRPRVALSPQVAWDGKHSWIKLVNKSARAIVDIHVQVDVLRPRTAKGGIWFQRHAVTVSGTTPPMLPGTAQKRDDSNAYRFRMDLHPDDVFSTGSNAQLRFRIFARDEVTGAGRLVERMFSHRSDVVSGEFEKGQGFTIT